MSHKTLINGTSYEVGGGKALVNATSYDIKQGKTLVGGSAYTIKFRHPLYIYNEGAISPWTTWGKEYSNASYGSFSMANTSGDHICVYRSSSDEKTRSVGLILPTPIDLTNYSIMHIGGSSVPAGALRNKIYLVPENEVTLQGSYYRVSGSTYTNNVIHNTDTDGALTGDYDISAYTGNYCIYGSISDSTTSDWGTIRIWELYVE